VPALLRGLGACWAVCAATGSGLAAAVERLGEAERAAADQRRAVQVELAGPRATARMLAVLPVVGLLMAAGLGADPLGFLLTTLPGRLCLVVGVALEVAGLRWTTCLSARAAVA
jgi:tight adherence protein B